MAELVRKMSIDACESIALMIDDASALSKYWFPDFEEPKRVIKTLEEVQRVVDETECYALVLDLSGSGPYDLPSRFHGVKAPTELYFRRRRYALGLPRELRQMLFFGFDILYELTYEHVLDWGTSSMLLYGVERDGKFVGLDKYLAKHC